MRIMLELSTEDGQFRVLLILSLALLSDINYTFKQIQPLNPLMDKLYACTRLTRKLRMSGDTWKPYQYTLVHQQCIGKTTQVAFMLLNLKQLLLELKILSFLSGFYQTNLIILFLFQNMIILLSCRHICAPNHVQVKLSVRVING